jgi:xanthine dehydrogenase YagS FAD-binding subunit
MLPFAYHAVDDVREAIDLLAREPDALCIAGGTDVMQLLQEAVIQPRLLIDLNALPDAGIRASEDGLAIGALTRLADVADDTRVRQDFPVLAQALAQTASPQIRNMATVGGNLLQRTRCLYFRDAAVPCNKRVPGSGCPAWDGRNRMNAILGGSPACIAAYPGDMANALIVLDAHVHLRGPAGERRIAVEALHRLPGDAPEQETILSPGEIITDILLPAHAAGRRSHYLKVRDRASFEWALVSVAVALDFADGAVRAARVAAGGVGTRPWRLHEVEQVLIGRPLDAAGAAAAGELATRAADPRPGNAFKLPLLRHTVAQALRIAGGIA